MIPKVSLVLVLYFWSLLVQTQSLKDFKLRPAQFLSLLTASTNKAAPHSNHPRLPSRLVPTSLELITGRGYRGEKYEVTTDDGYVLSLHRVANESGRPVLVMHGLFSSSDQWLVLEPSLNLPFSLAEAGFDVWLGDLRGNALSKSHVHYSNKDKRFWDFSFHEGGHYDLPALIDFILYKTGEDRLFYIGHSMGTTVFFVMASTRPEYNSKVSAAALLAPVARVPPRYRWNQFLKITDHAQSIYKTLIKNGIYEVLPRTEMSAAWSKNLCGNSITQPLCLDLFDFTLGLDRNNVNLAKLGYYSSTFPAGTSAKTLYHLGQIFKSDCFAKFDYGKEENEHRYGTPTPPSYNLSMVTVPVALYYGLNDRVVSPESVDMIAKSVGHLLTAEAVGEPMYGHLDFMFGINSKTLVYKKIIRLFDLLK